MIKFFQIDFVWILLEKKLNNFSWFKKIVACIKLNISLNFYQRLSVRLFYMLFYFLIYWSNFQEKYLLLFSYLPPEFQLESYNRIIILYYKQMVEILVPHVRSVVSRRFAVTPSLYILIQRIIWLYYTCWEGEGKDTGTNKFIKTLAEIRKRGSFLNSTRCISTKFAPNAKRSLSRSLNERSQSRYGELIAIWRHSTAFDGEIKNSKSLYVSVNWLLYHIRCHMRSIFFSADF